jgi:glyoxylase-like metal-dependent hydrolase (beta-lactamase superfamily II)
MANHKGRSGRRYVAPVLTVIVALGAVLVVPLVAPFGARAQGKAAQRHAPAPRSLRLYVFDCGKLNIDPTPYGFTKDDLATTDMSVPCFLVAHPKGTLMWDAGVLPDRVFTSPGSVRQDRATVTTPLKAQLAEAGYTPGDITYLALSHCHFDHTANANDFAGATWLVRKQERDAMFVEQPTFGRCFNRENFSALRNSKTVILTEDDYDVFGDGTVIIKSAPGHTPGHQVLFLKLSKTGPVLLSGDLYHYPEERAQHHVPTTEFNREQTAATRVAIEAFLNKSGAQLWIQHDFTANTKLKKAPAYYD